MITLCHKEAKEKRYEFEASWISDGTEGVHRIVPKDRRDEEEARAQAEIDTEMAEE